MLIQTDLFLTKPLPANDGYTWTICSRLGDALAKAENLFGKRDYEYTILGVEFFESEQPQVWYPGNRKHILIQLNQVAIGSMNDALYQLAHEVVHCLSPKGLKAVNVLEEGLATYFSGWYMHVNNLGPWHPTLPEYKEALGLVNILLAFDKDIIKRVRDIQPTISDISDEDLLKINPKLDKVLIRKLCVPFYRKSHDVLFNGVYTK